MPTREPASAAHREREYRARERERRPPSLAGTGAATTRATARPPRPRARFTIRGREYDWLDRIGERLGLDAETVRVLRDLAREHGVTDEATDDTETEETAR